MNKRKLLYYVLFFSYVFIFTTIAEAAPSNPGANATIEQIETLTSSITEKLLSFARSLFMGLSILSLAIGLGKSILSGESNIGSIAAHLAKWMIYVGIFFWIMSNADAISFIPKIIVNSFMEAGKSISGQDVKPDNILVSGIRIYGTMVERGWDAGWGDFIGIILIGIIILVVTAMMASALAFALIEMHLVICGGTIILGFGGFEYTRDIAFSYLRYSVSVGMKILMIMIIFRLTEYLLTFWEAKFILTTDIKELISLSGEILGGVICLFMAARSVPSMAQSVITGATINAGHEAVTSAASGLANMGKTSIQSLTQAGSAVKNVIKGARSTQTAAFRGMANTIDAAKEGGAAGAVSYVAAATPGVRNLMSAAKSGGIRNMAGYVAATALFGSQSERARKHLTPPTENSMTPGNTTSSPESIADRALRSYRS